VIPSFVTCVLCLDDVDVNNPDVYVDACPDDSHPGFHKECLLQYIDSKVKMGFPGSCPSMLCPCLHSGNSKRVLRYSVWKPLDKRNSQCYHENANTLLGILCSSCDVPCNLSISYDHDAAVQYEKMKRPDIYDSFADDLLKYEHGVLTASEFYSTLLNQHFPEFKSGIDSEVWKSFKFILQILEDPERRVNLHLCHLKYFPRIWTPCCNQNHCFRCRTKGFHTGVTCEQNIMTMDMSIVSCPACGVFLTKGDGCNSVVCVCGNKFKWNEEKLHANKLFEFQSRFPADTSLQCAQILCQHIIEPDIEELALAWHSRNQMEVNRQIFKTWRDIHPISPERALAVLNLSTISKGLKLVVNLWESSATGFVIYKYREAIYVSKKSLFTCMSPSESEYARTACILKDSSYYFGREIQGSCDAWITDNNWSYVSELRKDDSNSINQFLILYGHKLYCHTSPDHMSTVHSKWYRNVRRLFADLVSCYRKKIDFQLVKVYSDEFETRVSDLQQLNECCSTSEVASDPRLNIKKLSTQGYEVLKPFIDHICDKYGEVEAPSLSGLSRNLKPSWNVLLSACCWKYFENKKRNQQAAIVGSKDSANNRELLLSRIAHF